VIVKRRLIIATLLAAVLTAPVWLTPSVQGKNIDQEQTSLYMLESHYGRTLIPLHSRTLADQTYMTGITIGGLSQAAPASSTPLQMVESPDGTVLSTIVNSCSGCSEIHAKYITIRVIQLQTGVQRAKFHPRVPIDLTYVADDGSRVGGYRTGTSIWSLVDTRTGKVVSRVQTEPASSALYDPTSNYLYAVKVGNDHRLVVDAYAVGDGAQTAHLHLSNIPAGTWTTGAQIGDQAVVESAAPGVALSPDGKHIAVLNGRTDELTTIETPTMHVASVQGLSRPQTLLQRVGGLLGLTPSVALAKGGSMEGAWLTMRYSRDGRSLYVTGFKGVIDQYGHAGRLDIGLRRLDISTAQVTGEVLHHAPPVAWLGEAADATSVYTMTYSDSDTYACPCTLRRHDPITLTITAERTFDTYSTPRLLIVK
jgi:hypothetical protein